jgi:hypothetical protein
MDQQMGKEMAKISDAMVDEAMEKEKRPGEKQMGRRTIKRFRSQASNSNKLKIKLKQKIEGGLVRSLKWWEFIPVDDTKLCQRVGWVK